MIEQECIDYANSSENEVCGLIVNNSLIRCANTHPEPDKHFRISDVDWLNAESQGKITAVFHSHPIYKPTLSPADRVSQLSTGIDWWLASGGQLTKFRPVPYLLGRRFEHGKTDCYTLFRDAYHLCGVDLPDFERTGGWWLRGENLYIKNMELNGFIEIDKSEIKPGDVIILRAFPEADPCHSMIYLGDNVVLHHDHVGLLSRREQYRPAYIKLTHTIWRYQCSNFSLQGVLDDISAKSL